MEERGLPGLPGWQVLTSAKLELPEGKGSKVMGLPVLALYGIKQRTEKEAEEYRARKEAGLIRETTLNRIGDMCWVPIARIVDNPAADKLFYIFGLG